MLVNFTWVCRETIWLCLCKWRDARIGWAYVGVEANRGQSLD